MLEEFGYARHGIKVNSYGNEDVYVRSFAPTFNAVHPTLTFPFVGQATRFFMVSIRPEYHTDLLPDSILKTEDAADFSDPEPHRNAIKKVFVSQSHFRDLQSAPRAPTRDASSRRLRTNHVFQHIWDKASGPRLEYILALIRKDEVAGLE